jgi:hypothetical protein
MCVHPLLWLLFGFSIRKWNPGFVTCHSYYLIEKLSQNRSHSLRFVPTCEHFRNPSCAKLVIAQPECDNVIEKGAWNFWKFTRKFWNCESSYLTIFLVNNLNKIITHCRWPPLRSWSWKFVCPFWTFYTIVLSSFTHYVLAINRA